MNYEKCSRVLSKGILDCMSDMAVSWEDVNTFMDIISVYDTNIDDIAEEPLIRTIRARVAVSIIFLEEALKEMQQANSQVEILKAKANYEEKAKEWGN